MNLIQRLIDDPNSSFKAEDAVELEKLPAEVLQRIAAGLQTQPDQVSDEESQEAMLRSDLMACQKDLVELISTEQDLRRELESFGNSEPSVLDRFVAVTNTEQPQQLTEESVMEFVNTSKTVTGMVLREAMTAREVSRAKAIEVIVSNSKVFTAEELRAKYTPELVKMAEFVQQTRPVESTVFNYEGVGLADQSINQTTTGSFGFPLDLPTTFR